MKRQRGVLCCTMALCLVWGVAYGLSPCQPNFDSYVGWQGGQKQTFIVSGDGPFPGALFRSVQLDIPNRGIWVGGGADTGCGRDVRLYVQGWYFFANNVKGAILMDPGATPVQIPADVTSNLDWWYLDGFGTYRLSDPFSVVLGLRFDHHNYFTDDPEIVNLLIPVPNQIRFDVNMVSTIPYVGFQWGPSYGLTMRVLYSPVGWIDAKSTLSQNNDGVPNRGPNGQNWLGGESNLGNKTFAELFGEYSRDVNCSIQLGIFGRGALLQATSRATVTETIENGAARYDVSYRRISWTVGAMGTVRFDVPQFLCW
jgi:hypothetical protein